MSWSISTRGTAEEIRQEFDRVQGKEAISGMIEAEQRDIDKVRELAVQFASQYEYVSVSAGGHWSVFGLDDERNKFGSINITINAASRPQQEQKSEILRQEASS